MRPTWHFVMPQDIRWMLELTSPRVKTMMGSYSRKLELTDEVFQKCNQVIAKELKNHNYLTRQELKKVLEDEGIATDVQRLGHIMGNAELDALICSGPKRGKQFTYALLEERVKKTKKITRDEALAKLALKYFTGHGPGQLKDFAWWAGLTVKDAFTGLDFVKSKFSKETMDNKTYWFSPSLKSAKIISPIAHLLSIYDEYIIAYKDRGHLGDGRYIEKMISMGNALTAVIIMDGKIVGTWKREIKKDKVIVKPSLFRKLSSSENSALETAVYDYGKFFSLDASLI